MSRHAIRLRWLAYAGGRFRATQLGDRGESRGNLLAEEIQHWTCYHRHAGATDSDVALETAPERDVVEVERGVLAGP